MRGKSKAATTHLLHQTVVFDVTTPMDDSTADNVPGVFCTGFRMEYKPGGAAISLPHQQRPTACRDGLPICFHSNNVWYKATGDPNGVVTNVIPSDAELGPGPFVQLTPNGPLTTSGP